MQKNSSAFTNLSGERRGQHDISRVVLGTFHLFVHVEQWLV